MRLAPSAGCSEPLRPATPCPVPVPPPRPQLKPLFSGCCSSVGKTVSLRLMLSRSRLSRSDANHHATHQCGYLSATRGGLNRQPNQLRDLAVPAWDRGGSFPPRSASRSSATWLQHPPLPPLLLQPLTRPDPSSKGSPLRDRRGCGNVTPLFRPRVRPVTPCNLQPSGGEDS